VAVAAPIFGRAFIAHRDKTVGRTLFGKFGPAGAATQEGLIKTI
jgi:hypothetical protein